MDNIFWIVFIGFIVMSAVFNAVGAKLKQAAAAAEKSRGYQKGPKKFNPFSGETPEEFFVRVQQEENSGKKLKLSKKHKKEAEIPFQEPENTNTLQFENPNFVVSDVPRITQKTNKKIRNKINAKDKSALRKATIINEVLAPPKAYKQ